MNAGTSGSLPIPRIGFGTWMRRGHAGRHCIEWALETGYRHIDTAQGYENEAMCGLAIENSGIPRPEIFITTKIKPQNLASGLLLNTLEESLVRLRTPYADMTLIHWPSPKDEVPMPVYVEALVEAHDRGLTRNIGLSNFTIPLIHKAEEIAGRGRFATLQAEVHVYMQNHKIVDFCKSRNIQVTAFSPLALGQVAKDKCLGAIARRHGATESQVALAFLLQLGFVVIPTSSNQQRIRENFAAQAITLAPDDLTTIRHMDEGRRLLNPGHAPEWD